MLDQEVLEMIREGYYEEPQLVEVIKKYLLNSTHREFLERNDLCVEAILNGRFPVYLWSEVETMLNEWNQTAGEKLFGF